MRDPHIKLGRAINPLTLEEKHISLGINHHKVVLLWICSPQLYVTYVYVLGGGSLIPFKNIYFK